MPATSPPDISRTTGHLPGHVALAAESGGRSTPKGCLAAAVGHVAVLLGPPSLGALGQQAGPRNAVCAVLILVVAASFATPAARTVSVTRRPAW
ncbi:hypothetical protein ACQ4WX_00285 [Streptomyces lasalocidi]